MDPREQERIFLEWIAEHQAIVAKVVRSFAAPEAQDELRQELAISIWQAVPAYRAESKVSTFVYRVSCHRAMTWVRGQRSYRKLIVGYEREARTALAASASDREPSEQRIECLYAALRRLDELDRSLMLMHFDGEPYREIAAATGLTESNVGARLSRARKRLADLIKEET